MSLLLWFSLLLDPPMDLGTVTHPPVVIDQV